jgi:hypothetical protein
MPHAFISYVRDDSDLVDYIAAVLEANGVAYWRDKKDIAPGMRWKDAIRKAISDGRYFVGIFSRAWESREKAYANEELILAIEELRSRPTDRAWFIPIKIDACAIPDRTIGAGERLYDINYIDLPELGWREGLTRLLRALGVADPKVELGDPLGPGLPPSVRARGGRIIIERITPATRGAEKAEGTVFTVTEGWVTRTSAGDIIAHLGTQAPHMHMQKFNEFLGLESFYIFCREREIAPGSPTTFAFSMEHEIPARTEIWDMNTSAFITTPVPIKIANEYTALGTLNGPRFVGTFTSEATVSFGAISVPITLQGSFNIDLDW